MDEELLNQLKTLYEGNDKTDDNFDSIAITYLAMAADKVLNRLYPYRQDERAVPKRYYGNVVEIALFMLYKRGAEGETRHTENGIDRAYENGDVPESLLDHIVPFVGVV